MTADRQADDMQADGILRGPVGASARERITGDRSTASWRHRARRFVPLVLVITLCAPVVAGAGAAGASPEAPARAADPHDQSEARRAKELIAATPRFSQFGGTERFGDAGELESTLWALTEGVDSVTDPLYDVVNGGGDIVLAEVDPAADGTTAVALAVDVYEDPYTSTSWTVGVTGPSWDFDVDLDGVIDYTAIFFNIGGALVGNVFDSGDNIVCPAFSTALPASSAYGMVFDTACIGNPQEFVWGAVMGYEDVGGGFFEFDYAPDYPALAGRVANPAYVPTGPDAIVAVNPGRVFESRAGQRTVDGQQQGVGRRRAGQVTAVVVAGRAGVPASAKAAVVNVTAIAPSDRGFVTLFPCGTARPGSSTLNYAPGEVVANGATIRLGTNGSICVYTHRAMDLIVDVTGYVPM
jgi:hypothetical protein